MEQNTAEISVEGLIEEQRRLSASENAFERVVGTLCVAGLLKRRLAGLTNAAVGQLMCDLVLDELALFSPAMTICQVATERLRHSSLVLVKSDKENLNQ